ncbi:hypothetical protein FRC07_007827 [Ceratobasidium sp. 392]|nr:hypothetical protein FRC07_007827 [Ceratobasidium sp. 392]
MDYNQKSVHPLWGPLLDDYLRESPLGENFITQATPDEISITLRIFKTGRPSWMDFELLLSLPNRPGQLWHFLDAELVPGCMRLLREHCKSNRVSLLDCVDRVIFQLADGLGRHKKLAELLGMTIEQLMEDNSIRWLGRQHLKDLDWYNVPERLNSFSCLPKSGGLRYPDVEFLMRVFKERPAVIILNLITRYWPHAQEDENSILNFMLDWGFLCLGDSAEAKILSKDQPDMKILVETYVTLMTNPSTSSKFLIINDAVRFVELLKVGPIVMIPQLVGKLIVSVLDRVWMELNAPNRKAKDTESIIQLGGAVLTYVNFNATVLSARTNTAN